MKTTAIALSFLMALAAPALAQSFPVTIDHAFGQTVIPSEPKRIVTWGWGSDDALVALGVVPVGIPYFEYAGDDDGYHAWMRDALDKLGAPLPKTLGPSRDVPAEQIAALDPDVIIAAYSGIDENEYKMLSQIAPVVAYPDGPWATPWQEVVRLAGEAVGKPGRAAEIVAETEAFVAETIAGHPEIGDATFAVVTDNDGQVGVYSGDDARLKLLINAGMTLAPAVTELAPKGEKGFYFSISQEQFAALRSDIVITWFESVGEVQAFLAQPMIARSTQVAAGAVASLNDEYEIGPISPPTPLSLRWGLPLYAERIAEAARKAGRVAP